MNAEKKITKYGNAASIMNNWELCEQKKWLEWKTEPPELSQPL